MEPATLPCDPALDAALRRWEHYGRPGLPDGGFSLGRPRGRQRRGIYRPDTGEAVLEPDGHILRMAPSPDGSHIAFQLADRADENAQLAILDVASGGLRRHPDIPCRYDPMVWDTGSRTVELVTGVPGRLHSLDVTTGRLATTAVAADARVRIFPGGRGRTLLAESRPGRPTRLRDRATGADLATFPAIVRVLPFGDDVLVDDGTGLHLLDPGSGTERWSWHDPTVRVTALAANGAEVLIAGVRAGRSVLIRLADGRPVVDRPVAHRSNPAVASDVSADAGRFHVLVEGPALPPRVVLAEDLLTSADSAGPTPATVARTRRHNVLADDGTPVPVTITSPARLDGPAPLILTCYGGFGVPSLPVFEPTVPAWIEHGGRYAIAQVRGGGEHGSAWRDAGRGPRKARGVDDLVCVARGLVDAGYTRPEQLVIVGASHGGVLAVSCALAAPGLCAGVVSTAAPLDLLNLRAHPLGHHWISEFGDPDVPDDRDRLRRISPLHRARTFPSGARLPRFLGIVLEADSRVASDDTHAVVDALRRAGGDAALWCAEDTGHGSNRLDSLHRLGATVLAFAATTTSAEHADPTTTWESIRHP
ncbi:S9 family peptidase [Saccharomonospora piscinae]|uniref:prolyl oligopeptidase family serine peptidase n=1 Tax=Saccharomonospora piscinae TaxID=687388 RepID=UPI001106D570|nr:prolyl oligopeptidase family serine peptidase [Saccharomonospora piscinae]TLW90347.1 S9 family peptidase [Saccharomonospora piscinae]